MKERYNIGKGPIPTTSKLSTKAKQPLMAEIIGHWSISHTGDLSPLRLAYIHSRECELQSAFYPQATIRFTNLTSTFIQPKITAKLLSLCSLKTFSVIRYESILYILVPFLYAMGTGACIPSDGIDRRPCTGHHQRSPEYNQRHVDRSSHHRRGHLHSPRLLHYWSSMATLTRMAVLPL